MFFRYLIFAYLIGVGYLFVRGWQSLEILGRRRVWFVILFCIITIPYVLMRQRIVTGALYDVFFIIGYTLSAVLLYGFLILLFIDLLRLVGWIGNIRPVFIYSNYRLTKVIMFGAVCITLAVVIAAGYYNAFRPRATNLAITVDKKAGRLSSLRVAMACDMHLGNIHGRKSLARIVNTINEQHPDIILLVGDIFEGNPEVAIKSEIGEEFKRLQCKYGVYMVNGNHDRTGARGSFDYWVSHGIQPLFDTNVLVDSSFYVVGRIDRSSRNRKTIPELIGDIDRQLPVILLDHQPFDLEETAQAGIDLQLSGHTHRGQMFPLNFVTAKLFEHDWGLVKKSNTNFYISCGAGTWGPPIRTTGYAEVVIIDLAFQ
jgi:predicted MPP superfamily phosphohydrolase